MVRAEIGLLADLGRKADARTHFAQAESDGSLAAASDLDVAYLAVRLGDDRAANDRFERAHRAAELTGSALLDAAYAAKRSFHNAEAIDFFKTAIDENGAAGCHCSRNPCSKRAARSPSWSEPGAHITLTYGAVGVMPSCPWLHRWRVATCSRPAARFFGGRP